jgi:hypothetical protein
MNYGAVIVETRPLENINRIIHSHMNRLPKDWGLTIFCSVDNQHMMPHGANLIVMPSAFMNEMQYNKLLTSFAFWQNVPYDKCLVFQHDSELFKAWDSDFEKWDYIGAPWKFQQHGGNGGLSWRSVAAMKWCLQQIAYNPTLGNEDVYFSDILAKSFEYRLAPREHCEKFAVETIFQLGTFGGHAIDKWLSLEECVKIRKQYDTPR